MSEKKERYGRGGGGVEGRREAQEIYGGHRHDTYYTYNRIAHAQICTLHVCSHLYMYAHIPINSQVWC